MYKYRKLIYIISMILFAMLGSFSVAKGLAMLAVLASVLLSSLELRPLKAMNKFEFVVAGAIVATYLSFNYYFFHIGVVLLALASLYFIIHSIDICCRKFSSITQSQATGTHLNKCGKVSRMELIVIAITSVVVITIFSTSSPLYAMNFWNDSNIFFTVGRGMTKGLIPYKDLFEQKGPWFLFIYAISAFISSTSFVGVYLFEIAECFIFTLFVWKTVHLFYTPSKSSIVLIPLGTTLTYLCASFHFGGGAEEFCIPFLAAIFYIACKAERNDRLPSVKEAVIIGTLTGIIIYSKYTTCGFVFGYIIFILYKSISSRKIAYLFKLIGGFISGIVLISIPLAIYFISTGAICEFVKLYFYDNMFAYSVGIVSFGDFFTHIFDLNYNSFYIQYGLFFSLLALPGMKKNMRIMYSLILLFSLMALYLPGRYYFYYVFVLVAVTIPGYILLSVLWDELCSKLKKVLHHLDKVAIVACLATLLIAFATYRNLFFVEINKDDLPQYKFGKIINQTPDAKILTYDIMDFGFYLGADTVPSTWYFCFTNMNRLNPTYYKKLMTDEIERNAFDYIITSSDRYEWNNYRIIASAQMSKISEERNGIDYNEFFLYQKIT